VDDLAAKGCKAVSLDEVREGQTVVIRSHGVSREIYKALRDMGASVVDATCPFVERIHKTALEMTGKGFTVLIAGDASHPEVEGIRGFCETESFVFADIAELEELLNGFDERVPVCVLSQTTFNKEMWEQCRKRLETLRPDAHVFETICSATAKRQEEAEQLSRKADLMIIVGGRHSSNTHKLAQVCEKNCRTLFVENAGELKRLLTEEDLKSARFIGISAGASTPGYIIEEVQQAMTELNENINTVEEEEDVDFATAYEATIKPIHKGMKVDGTVTAINANGEVIVDIGTKHTGYISPSELSDDQTKKPEEIVSVGDTIKLIVLQTSDEKGTVELSKRRVDAAIGLEKIAEAKENGTVLTGVVTNTVKGGVIVSSNGVRVFIPASQAVPRGGDLEELLKKTVDFKILEVNEQRQKAVGSIRAVEREARDAAKNKFFETAKAGDVIEGEVKSITEYGVFVDLGGVDGLVRRMDLSWKRIKHPSEVVSIGDKIEVRIKEIDPETGKVSLIYRKDDENPWKVFTDNYSVDQDVTVKIVSITSFGAFAQIIDGVDGLIHISQIANQRVDNVADVLKVGQEVNVKITEIDYDKKRISLSIRALLPAEDEE
jgi:4-hydroxy-3-methylbut-2-enyl diphosphate reductase